jgi:hypothetical protein
VLAELLPGTSLPTILAMDLGTGLEILAASQSLARLREQAFKRMQDSSGGSIGSHGGFHTQTITGGMELLQGYCR